MTNGGLGGDESGRSELPRLGRNTAAPARIWDYWLGGKDNFAADRETAHKVAEAMPSMPLLARAGRRFLTDAVHRLAARDGIRQFLDIGAGLPAAGNTHEIAQRVAPESRVVYVDNDPVVIAHARALLPSGPEGATDYLQADLRDTGTILDAAGRTLDLSRPLGVLLVGVLHFIPDADNPYAVVTRVMDAVASGSYLVIGHAARDAQPGGIPQTAAARYNMRTSAPITLRTREEVTRFFDGLELVSPGVVPLARWWIPEDEAVNGPGELAGYCGIGCKPGPA